MLHLLIDVGLEGRKAEQSSSHKAMKRLMDIENHRWVTPEQEIDIGTKKVDSGKRRVLEESKENGGIEPGTAS